MSRTPLFDALKEYNTRSSGYFRIPGHRFERGIPAAFTDFAGSDIFRLDVTETPMTDDLHRPESVIAESQAQTGEAFGAARSFYLVNGTSCGNESMIMAVSGEGSGGCPDTILVPRNAHKSVMAGLIISGAKPVYMQPEYIPEYGITGVLRPETAAAALNAEPDAKAVFTVSPSYHGICSDLASIAEAAHSRCIPLLVDEAHGAHLYFGSGLPDGALSLGADACAQSLHKTCGALTQASLLHVGRDAAESGRINIAGLDSALRMTMSTSPSYILMCSLELTRAELELRGEEYWARTIELAESVRSRINTDTAFRCPGAKELKAAGAFDVDPTRLVVNCDALNISGYELKEMLWDRYGIDVEMADSRSILLLFSYGNTAAEADAFIRALEQITAESNPASAGAETCDTGRLPAIPEMALTPRQAYFSETLSIPWNDMVGRIAAEPAAPYPPGIPVVYPGEVITEEIFGFLDKVKREGRHMHGLCDVSLESIRVCRV